MLVSSTTAVADRWEKEASFTGERVSCDETEDRTDRLGDLPDLFVTTSFVTVLVREDFLLGERDGEEEDFLERDREEDLLLERELTLAGILDNEPSLDKVEVLEPGVIGCK